MCAYQAILLNVFRRSNLKHGVSLVDIAREFGFPFQTHSAVPAPSEITSSSTSSSPSPSTSTTPATMRSNGRSRRNSSSGRKSNRKRNNAEGRGRGQVEGFVDGQHEQVVLAVLHSFMDKRFVPSNVEGGPLILMKSIRRKSLVTMVSGFAQSIDAVLIFSFSFSLCCPYCHACSSHSSSTTASNSTATSCLADRKWSGLVLFSIGTIALSSHNRPLPVPLPLLPLPLQLRKRLLQRR